MGLSFEDIKNKKPPSNLDQHMKMVFSTLVHRDWGYYKWFQYSNARYKQGASLLEQKTFSKVIDYINKNEGEIIRAKRICNIFSIGLGELTQILLNWFVFQKRKKTHVIFRKSQIFNNTNITFEVEGYIPYKITTYRPMVVNGNNMECLFKEQLVSAKKGIDT